MSEASGRRIDDRERLERIRELTIPPAWRDVWICDDPLGHLQATGIDAAGRKQYLYHQRWRTRRAKQKFDAMLDFATALPRLRRHVARALRAEALDRERILACATRLLDIGFFRVGSEEYAEHNGSYGLTTIRKDHIGFDRDLVIFDYPAKGGAQRVQAVTDPDTARILHALKRRRGGGDGLLAYRNGRRWQEIDADELNHYLKQHLEGDFTAKDFRTWNATVLAAVALAGAAANGASRSSGEHAIREAIQVVASYLGNTPAVCRSSYTDPRVFDRFRSGRTIAPALNGAVPDVLQVDLRARQRIESAVVAMLRDTAGP